MKRIISVILSAAIACSALPMSAFAAEGDILYPAGTVIDEDAEILAAVMAAEDTTENTVDIDDPEFALSSTERTYETLAEKPELTEDEKLEVLETLIAAQEEITDYPVTASVNDEIKLLYRTDKEFAVTYVAGYEYSIDSGASWNTAGVFANIVNGTEYTVTVRDKVTLETVCTLTVAVALKPKAPKRPTATSIDRTSVTVKTEAGVEYSIDNGSTWRTDGVFSDLKPGTEYTIISRYAATGSALASEYGDPLTVTTVPADTYVVSDETELLSALAEISTLQATKPRVNVRFKNNITISDTLVIPRLKGRMTVYLDLYGFTLKCTKRDVPVVEINTRATLGSSYYLNSGVSSEEIRGGNITATGTGCGIDIGAGAIVALNGLTFNCDIAIVSSGEIESLENIHGRIKNSGYIGEITGTELTVNSVDDWAIYNEGTIEQITNCTLSDKTKNELWRGEYDTTLTGVIHNLGYIGNMNGVQITTYRPAAIVNADSSEIDSLADNSIKNQNYYRGVVCLNFGTIDKISDGSYSAWTCDFINEGTIGEITGGYFNTNSDSAGTVENKIKEDELAFLKTTNDTYACFDNRGSIDTVSGGVYYGGYSTYGRGYWYPDGSKDTQENCGENNRSWIDYKAFSCADSAVLNFADGFGMSRSMHKYKDYGSGYKVDRLYKVAYDMSEAKCYFKADGSIYPSALVIEDNGAEALSAPDYLYYCEGDTVYRNNPFARGYYGSTDSGWLRILKGQFPDYGKKTQYCKIDNGTAVFENKYLADVMYDSVYYLSSLAGSEPELMNSYSFKMPAKDITYTPVWSYRKPGYKGFANSRLGYQAAYRNATNTVLVNADFEADLVSSEGGTVCTVTAHGLDDFLPFASGTTPVSGFAEFTDTTRPYHYEWSLDGDNWHRDNESAAVTDSAATVYLRIVANDDSYDASTNVANSKTFAVQIISLDLEGIDSAPNGSTVMLTAKNEVTITAALGTATQKGDGIEVQVALEDEQGNITPYDLGSDGITYHSDIARLTSPLVLSNIPDKSKVKARFRQYQLGYRHLENPTSDGDNWTLGYISAWSAWQSVTAKADVSAPVSAPVLVKRLDTSIIVKAEAGLEYSIDNGGTWQTSGEFTGLTPDTEYSIVSRVAETDLTNASPNSPALTVRTRPSDDVLTAPVLESKTDTSIKVEKKDGYEYSIDGGETWQSDSEFNGLEYGTEYEIICRREDEPDYTSPSLIVSTVFPAPVLVKRTNTTITVETKDGLEYSIDNINWQKDGEFTGLAAGTRYEIVARKEAETDNISAPLIVSTKTVQGSPSTPPELVSKTDTTITVKAESDMEYSIDGGSTWQASGDFTGLSEGTEYEIISRFAETDDCAASAASEPLVVTTKTYPTAEIIPPNILSVTVTSISVEPEESQEYAVYTAEDDTFVQGWYTDGEFSGLVGDTKYKVVTRICETEETVASDIGTAVVLVNTDKRHNSSAPSEPDDTETVIPADLHYAYVYGFPDGTVRPGKSITRAEAVAVLARAFPQAAALDLDTEYFTDVNEGAWYFEQVQLMAQLGIARGYSDGTFKPNEPITRAEFVTLASRFKAVADNGSGIDFTDIYASWAKDSIIAMSSEGYINGYADGTFKPAKNITRAEAITVVYRMVGADCEKSREKRVWPDCNDTSMWYYKAIMEASVTHEAENKEDNNES